MCLLCCFVCSNAAVLREVCGVLLVRVTRSPCHVDSDEFG
jgi:hypothetical protein